MFDLDSWEEILSIIKQKKLRSALTAFSVAWGIFMLVILLGSGNALHNGVVYQFRNDATNSIWIYPGQTSLAFDGFQPGRNLKFYNDDYKLIERNSKGIEHIASLFKIKGTNIIKYNEKSGSFNVQSCSPSYKHLANTEMIAGRFINELDMKNKRKVATIGALVQEELFESENPIGKYITFNNINYKVIGVFKDEGGEDEMRKIYIPISTAQMLYGRGDKIHQVMMTLKDPSIEKSELLTQSIRNTLSQKHHFDPSDERAVRVSNKIDMLQNLLDVISGINIFVLFIGITTLLAGIIGVSNIMLVSVKERTKEIGIRKALGAKPNAIIIMILKESLFITSIAGYLGLLGGAIILNVLNSFLPENDFFMNPKIDINIALGATALLVISGLIAGYFPARKAAMIEPIVALRDE